MGVYSPYGSKIIDTGWHKKRHWWFTLTSQNELIWPFRLFYSKTVSKVRYTLDSEEIIFKTTITCSPEHYTYLVLVNKA